MSIASFAINNKTSVAFTTAAKTNKDTGEDFFRSVNNSLVEFKKQANIFEKFSKNFIVSNAKIMFVSEYILDGKLIGSLVCWDIFDKCTHYEIFKRNLFSAKNKNYERILFLDKKNIQEETKKLLPYVHDVLGFHTLNETNCCLMLDTQVKKDRIYQYKIRATRVPQNPLEIDYDTILECNDKTFTATAVEGVDLSHLAQKVFGTSAYAWIISLMNDNVVFFGLNSKSASVNQNGETPEALLPKDKEDIVRLMTQSASLFGVKKTFNNILNVLGGLPEIFIKTATDSIDEDDGNFNFDLFSQLLDERVPTFKLLKDIASATSSQLQVIPEEIKDLTVVLPKLSGTTFIFNIDGLTKALSYIDAVFIAVTSADSSSVRGYFQKISLMFITNKQPQNEGIYTSLQLNQISDRSGISVDELLSLELSVLVEVARNSGVEPPLGPRAKEVTPPQDQTIINVNNSNVNTNTNTNTAADNTAVIKDSLDKLTNSISSGLNTVGGKIEFGFNKGLPTITAVNPNDAITGGVAEKPVVVAENPPPTTAPVESNEEEAITLTPDNPPVMPVIPGTPQITTPTAPGSDIVGQVVVPIVPQTLSGFSGIVIPQSTSAETVPSVGDRKTLSDGSIYAWTAGGNWVLIFDPELELMSGNGWTQGYGPTSSPSTTSALTAKTTTTATVSTTTSTNTLAGVTRGIPGTSIFSTR